MTVQTSTTRPVNDPNGGPFTPTEEDLARVWLSKARQAGTSPWRRHRRNRR